MADCPQPNSRIFKSFTLMRSRHLVWALAALVCFAGSLSVQATEGEAVFRQVETATDTGLFAFAPEISLPPLESTSIRGMVMADGVPQQLALQAIAEGQHRVYRFDHASDAWLLQDTIETFAEAFIGVPGRDAWFVFGRNADGTLDQALALRISNSELKVEPLPAPPALQRASATLMRERLYLAGYGGDAGEQPLLFELNLRRPAGGWLSVPAWDAPQAEQLHLAAVHDTLLLFAMAGDATWGRAFRSLTGWRELDPPPHGIVHSQTVACGQAHLLGFATQTDSSSLYSYHVTTDRWVSVALAEPLFPVLAALRTGELSFYLAGEHATRGGESVLQGTRYGWLDHAVVVLFMLGMLMIGWRLSRRENSNNDYFRGGQRIPFWASGLSLFATGASAISLMAMPGMAFSTDWTYLSISLYILLSTLVVLFIYVPLARRLNVATANEYLERRYGLTIRLIGSVIYSANQILARLAAIMLLPAIALSAIIGMPMETSILIMGLVTTAYATMGGLEGVIWTDVIQAVVMILAVLLCASWAVVMMDLSPGTAFASLQSFGKLNIFDPSFGLLGPTMFVLFINAFVTTLGMMGDQNFIQRVQCTPSERDAKKAVLTQILVAVPLNVVLFSLGTILFLFYLERPQMLNPTIMSDGIFPVFAAQNLPAGLAGVVIAALFAATMSTLSSAINSTANIGVEDFFRRLKRTPPSDKACLRLGKVLTLILGLLGTASALWLANSDLRSVWDLAIMIAGMILGPIAGFFLLGIFTRRANSAGVLIGGIAAIVATAVCREFTPIHHFLYLPVGVFTCLIVGYTASLLFPPSQKDLQGLTVYTLFKNKG